jgi:hypothetical protein
MHRVRQKMVSRVGTAEKPICAKYRDRSVNVKTGCRQDRVSGVCFQNLQSQSARTRNGVLESSRGLNGFRPAGERLTKARASIKEASQILRLSAPSEW